MTTLDFTKAELELLAQFLVDVALTVAAVGSDSLVGQHELKIELSSGQRQLHELAAKFPHNALIQGACDEIEAEKLWPTQPEQAVDRSLDALLPGCGQIAALLDQKASAQEAGEFKQYALLLAEQVAGAAGGAGGFQRFGRAANKVSGKEAEVLKRIATALETPWPIQKQHSS